METEKRPPIAITMGDPAGIGPELVARLLADDTIHRVCVPVVFGDEPTLSRAASQFGLGALVHAIPLMAWVSNTDPIRTPTLVDIRDLNATPLRPGHVDAHTGRASVAYVEAAIQAALAGRVAGVATGPIHKEAIHAAGVPFPGHTELFMARTQTTRACMMLTSEAITCSLVTVHVGLNEVAGLLTHERVLTTIELTAAAMRALRGRPPRLTVCGLNPHAGENGLFGNGEEETVIRPAIQEAIRHGIDVRGPVAPDTAFLPSLRAQTDAYICMYHDQGLIPLKALAFDRAVNVTLGLPIIRTSVDHGTALDLVGKGTADPSSFREAVLLAVRLAQGAASASGGSGT